MNYHKNTNKSSPKSVLPHPEQMCSGQALPPMHQSRLLQTTIATESSFLPLDYKPQHEHINVTEIKTDSHILVPTIVVKNRIEETKREYITRHPDQQTVISPRSPTKTPKASSSYSKNFGCGQIFDSPTKTPCLQQNSNVTVRERRKSFDKLVSILYEK